MKQIVSRVETITPQIAQEYLTHNINNRMARPNVVDLYAEQMKKGLWTVSNDAISFSEDGELLNGQHRLKAVIQAGVACEFVVTRNLPRHSFEVMDNGVQRSARDVFYIEGVNNYTNLSAICKRKIVLSNSRITIVASGISRKAKLPKIGNAQIYKEYCSNKTFYDNVVRDSIRCYSKSRLLSISDYGGFISYLSLTLNHPYETALSFFEEFSEIKKNTNDVVILLRNKLLNDKLSSAKITSVARQKLIIKAWNAYVTGKTLKLLKYVESTDKDLWFI